MKYSNLPGRSAQTPGCTSMSSIALSPSSDPLLKKLEKMNL